METGGDYTVSVTTSTASGAYGFLDSSWGGYGGYARAKDAPPAVQDAKAAELATYILDRNGGDVSTIPVSWYIGHVPVGAEWDTVPRPTPATGITPREYQGRWLNTLRRAARQPRRLRRRATADVDGRPSTRRRRAAPSSSTSAEPGAPQYVLTQAQTFLVDDVRPRRARRRRPVRPGPRAVGRAAADGPAPTADPTADDRVGTLNEPVVVKTTGPR